jgi:hypothetical protein
MTAEAVWHIVAGLVGAAGVHAVILLGLGLLRRV